MKAQTLSILVIAFTLMLGCVKEPATTTAPRVPNDDEVERDTVNNDDPPIGGASTDTIDVNHYILTFVEPQYFRLSNHTISTSLSLEYRTKTTYSYKDDPNSEAGKKYADLCKRYNDISYDSIREFWLCYAYHCGYDYLSNNLTSIELVTLTDYNKQYPAGSSLNDICMLECKSPRQYIADGYTGEIKKTVTKPLSQCTTDDLVLIGSGDALICYLRFTEPPILGAKQKISARITDEAGNMFECTTEEFMWDF